MSNEVIVRDDFNVPHGDPVIEFKRKAVLRMMEAAKLFQRVDIQLLQMVSPYDSNYPAFAVQTLDDYERHFAASCSGSHHTVGGREMFRDVLTGCGFMAASATPKGNIPQSAKAKVAEHAHRFDNLLVAWDASQEWSAAVAGSTAVASADPLILGEIDGVWFCVAKWDLTKLESYFLD